MKTIDKLQEKDRKLEQSALMTDKEVATLQENLNKEDLNDEKMKLRTEIEETLKVL